MQVFVTRDNKIIRNKVQPKDRVTFIGKRDFVKVTAGEVGYDMHYGNKIYTYLWYL